jgi:hypothetical protein
MHIITVSKFQFQSVLHFLFLLFILLTPTSSLYFELKQNKEKCFIDFYDNQGIGIVKYELFNPSPVQTNGAIHIKFYSEQNQELVTRHIIKSQKGKFSFVIDRDTGFKICALNVNSKEVAYLDLKFESENIEEIDINNAVSQDDIDNVLFKINKSIKMSSKIIKKQLNERESEEKVFQEQKYYSKVFIVLTLSQISILVISVLYLVNSLRKYLINKNYLEK